jgi:alpha 1,3-glucosidase
VELHVPEVVAANEESAENTDQHGQTGGMWKSLQRRLLGSNDGSDSHNKALDPYVRGPPPTLTGRLEMQTDTTNHQLLWTVSALSDGIARMRVTELYGQAGTAYEQARVTYDDLVLLPDGLQSAEHAVLLNSHDDRGKQVLQHLVGSDNEHLDNFIVLEFGDANGSSSTVLLIELDPFVVRLYRQADIDAGHRKPIIELGAQQMMHFEVRKLKQQQGETVQVKAADEASDKEVQQQHDKKIVGYWEDGLAIYEDGTREEKKDAQEQHDGEAEHRQLSEADEEGLWEEKFQSHTDSKPFGPMSVGIDVSFPQSSHIYGIPEHASSATLKTTRGEGAHYQEPYRLYNLDVFEYELDETMALYGNIPFLVSQSRETGTSGVFYFNPTETFVDILHDQSRTTSHWISESGILDVFLLPGPDPKSLYRQYARLTGTTSLPPMFSLGYHQCRWNYKDEKDVYQVHDKFEELDYPYDVLWLDIEHTDGKKYFTWDKAMFPNPKDMQVKLASQGRRMVTIVDPHIKRDDSYYIHKEATQKGLYIKDKDGVQDYDGWCWPGASSYLDFTAEHVRSWWAEQFGYDRYQESTNTLFTWNDMNEPSVFNGPEISMQKDLKNLAGHEHREWHNLYGMLLQRATVEGLIKRNKPIEDVRPFVLSRSFFAGAQRYGAIWTGDNTAEWGHLVVAAPMLLSMNAAALSFVGADVGGFFGNPDAELMTRWMQAGAYQPFFRGHAHHDSKRREPWMFGDETLHRLRRSAMERYALLPFWYTVFRETEVTGMPVMRMMWMQYPETDVLYAVEDQYLIGSDLLVKPVTAAGITETEVAFPTDDIWYDAETLVRVDTSPKGASVEFVRVPSPIDKIPVFQRGGSIIPRKLRLRRSTMMMKSDPYTLYVALDASKKSAGALYMDDEDTFGYGKRNEYASATVTADLSSSSTGTIANAITIGSGWSEFADKLAGDRMVERIIIMGVDAHPKSISVRDGPDLEFTYAPHSNTVIIRKPELSAMAEWTISISMS